MNTVKRSMQDFEDALHASAALAMEMIAKAVAAAARLFQCMSTRLVHNEYRWWLIQVVFGNANETCNPKGSS